jgi:DNA-binding beta-propeller fold protein YncE
MSDECAEAPSVPVYEPEPGWGRVPLGVSLAGDATSVAVDSEDHVFIFNRGTAPVIVLDREGNFLESWGEGDFDRPHGIFIDDNDDLYLVDAGGHFIQKRTREGKVLLTIGTRGECAPAYSGGCFNEPTDVVVHPVTRELFITDGYANTAVHRFSPEGEHITTFGGTGCGDGQFSLPHGIELLDDDLLLVCDRENYRIQVFTTEGKYVDEWHAHKPCAVYHEQSEDRLYVAELGVGGSRRARNLPNFGHRVSIRARHGKKIGEFGAALPGFKPDQFFAPHDIAMDSYGDIYVAEVNCSFIATVLNQPYPMIEPPSLRKWRRVGSDSSSSQ